jgi:hypothetical protein
LTCITKVKKKRDGKKPTSTTCSSITLKRIIPFLKALH